MPEIQAKLGNTTRTGLNAVNRPAGDRTPPSTSIRANAPQLADIMDNLNKQGRSAYACAEAQALAKLLSALNAPFNFGEIEFNCPTDCDGKELWLLCGNCLEWLAKKSGFGSEKKFKISEGVLLKLNPPPAAAFNFNQNDFPKLK
jgi:hypothetical protein